MEVTMGFKSLLLPQPEIPVPYQNVSFFSILILLFSYANVNF